MLMDIIIVSGISGAGKSRVAAVLEDMDFYCVDNMPLSMMPKFAELCLATQGRYERVALVTDVRALENIDELFTTFEEMRELGCVLTILFIEAETETIIRRYKETRRRHPLDTSGSNLSDAVNNESTSSNEISSTLKSSICSMMSFCLIPAFSAGEFW